MNLKSDAPDNITESDTGEILVGKRGTAIIFTLFFLLAGVWPWLDNSRDTEIKVVVTLMLFCALAFACYDYYRTWQSRRRFGEGRCVLDPFPGRIGGTVAGELQFNSPAYAEVDYHLTLQHYQKGNVWRVESTLKPRLVGDSLLLPFQFDIPERNPEDTRYNKPLVASNQGRITQNPWSLKLKADLGKGHFYRVFHLHIK
jgi:hypothetical protein